MKLAIKAILTKFQQQTIDEAECDSRNRWKAAKRLHQTEKTTKNRRSQMRIVFTLCLQLFPLKDLSQCNRYVKLIKVNSVCLAKLCVAMSISQSRIVSQSSQDETI